MAISFDKGDVQWQKASLLTRIRSFIVTKSSSETLWESTEKAGMCSFAQCCAVHRVQLRNTYCTADLKIVFVLFRRTNDFAILVRGCERFDFEEALSDKTKRLEAENTNEL